MTNDKSVIIIQLHRIETPGAIGDYLSENSIPFKVIHPYRGDKLPEPDRARAIISLGCPESVADSLLTDWSRRLFHYLDLAHTADTPYLGLCYSAQLMAANRGAAVMPASAKEIGVYDVTLTEEGLEDPLFAGFPASFPVFHWHGEMFDIPVGGTLLACGETCRNQAFRSDNNWGVQFHLEADPDKLPLWCEEYAQEIPAAGKDAQTVLAEYEKTAPEIRRLCYQLLGNFFSLR
ncbi:MAG: type 1 glutamine amidotransferase [Candidatus Zixiibacteriota bacterium]